MGQRKTLYLRLLALTAVFLLAVSVSGSYSVSVSNLPVPIVRGRVDVWVVVNTSSTATYTLKAAMYIGHWQARLETIGKTRYVHISGVPLSLVINSVNDTETANPTDQYKETGKSDLDYWLEDNTVKALDVNTTYYSDTYYTATNKSYIVCKMLTADWVWIYVNNTLYWQDNNSYTNAFYFVPLPIGAIGNLTVKANKGNDFRLVETYNVPSHAMLISNMYDSNETVDDPDYSNTDMAVVGVENLDEFLRGLIEQKLDEAGISGDFEYNLTEHEALMSVAQVQKTSIYFAGIMLAQRTVVKFGWFDGIRDRIKKLSFTIGSTANSVVKFVRARMHQIRRYSRSFNRVVTTGIRNVYTKVSKTVSGAWKTVTTATGKTIKAVGGFFTGAAKAIKNFGSKVMQGAKTVFKTVSTAVGNVIHGVQKFFGGIVGFIKKFWWVILAVAVGILVLIVYVAARGFAAGGKAGF